MSDGANEDEPMGEPTNPQPGDRVRYVKPLDDCDERMLGRVGTVVGPAGPCWEVRWDGLRETRAHSRAELMVIR